MFDVQTLPLEGRMLIVGRGFWDVTEAREFYRAVSQGLKGLSARHRRIRVFADLSEHDLQSSAVSEINAATAEVIKAAPIERYALVVPSALLRLQARRLLAGISFQIFPDRAGAAEWLEWPLSEISELIDASTIPSID